MNIMNEEYTRPITPIDELFSSSLSWNDHDFEFAFSPPPTTPSPSNDTKTKRGKTWSDDEEAMLIAFRLKYKMKWCHLAKVFPGRSPKALKRYWDNTLSKTFKRVPETIVVEEVLSRLTKSSKKFPRPIFKKDDARDVQKGEALVSNAVPSSSSAASNSSSADTMIMESVSNQQEPFNATESGLLMTSMYYPYPIMGPVVVMPTPYPFVPAVGYYWPPGSVPVVSTTTVPNQQEFECNYHQGRKSRIKGSTCS